MGDTITVALKNKEARDWVLSVAHHIGQELALDLETCCDPEAQALKDLVHSKGLYSKEELDDEKCLFIHISGNNDYRAYSDVMVWLVASVPDDLWDEDHPRGLYYDTDFVYVARPQDKARLIAKVNCNEDESLVFVDENGFREIQSVPGVWGTVANFITRIKSARIKDNLSPYQEMWKWLEENQNDARNPMVKNKNVKHSKKM